MLLRSLLFAVLGLAITFASGCGPSEPVVKKYPVSGTVTFDDKPVEKGIIQFTNPADGGVDSMEITGGSFKGEVRSGKRRVEIIAKKEEPGPMPGVMNEVNYIPAKYNSQTTLEADIKEGPNEGLKYDLKS
jgi:hypothetical protein